MPEDLSRGSEINNDIKLGNTKECENIIGQLG
jgi:hypothetical protein